MCKRPGIQDSEKFVLYVQHFVSTRDSSLLLVVDRSIWNEDIVSVRGKDLRDLCRDLCVVVTRMNSAIDLPVEKVNDGPYGVLVERHIVEDKSISLIGDLLKVIDVRDEYWGREMSQGVVSLTSTSSTIHQPVMFGVKHRPGKTSRMGRLGRRLLATEVPELCKIGEATGYGHSNLHFRTLEDLTEGRA